MNAWQLPISSQSPAYIDRTAHWFVVSKQTDRIVAAACGKKVNPGFAIAGNRLLKCTHCKAWIGKRGKRGL